MTYSAAQLTEAGRLGAATLHEAAGRIGALPSAIKPVAPDMRIAGPAFTVHVPAGDNLWIHRAIYDAAAGDVLVVSTSGGVEWGLLGAISSTLRRSKGAWAGPRDRRRRARCRRALRHAFPGVSNGICLNGTIKGFQATAWLRQPVRIGSVVVAQGDLVVGDRDGVVVLPPACVPDALAAGAHRERDEAEKIARITAGERTIDIYGFGEAGDPR